MSNEYFNNDSTPLQNGSRALATAVEAKFNAVVVGFNRIPAKTSLQNNSMSLGTDSGAADAYIVTLAHTPTAYADGMQVIFKAVATNTGATTINVNSLGVKTIERKLGGTLHAGDIVANAHAIIRYNSTTGKFHLEDVSPAELAETRAYLFPGVLNLGSVAEEPYGVVWPQLLIGTANGQVQIWNHDALTWEVSSGSFSLTTHNHDATYAAIGHDHSGAYAPTTHNHDDRYYTESEADDLLSGKSDVGHDHSGVYAPITHNHDDRYYTESEADTLLAGKLADVAEDDSPQAGGEFDFNGHSAGCAWNNYTGTTPSFDLRNGNNVKHTSGAGNNTVSIGHNPSKICSMIWLFAQDATGERNWTLPSMTWFVDQPIWTAGTSNQKLYLAVVWNGSGLDVVGCTPWKS